MKVQSTKRLNTPPSLHSLRPSRLLKEARRASRTRSAADSLQAASSMVCDHNELEQVASDALWIGCSLVYQSSQGKACGHILRYFSRWVPDEFDTQVRSETFMPSGVGGGCCFNSSMLLLTAERLVARDVKSPSMVSRPQLPAIKRFETTTSGKRAA